MSVVSKAGWISPSSLPESFCCVATEKVATPMRLVWAKSERASSGATRTSASTQRIQRQLGVEPAHPLVFFPVALDDRLGAVRRAAVDDQDLFDFFTLPDQTVETARDARRFVQHRQDDANALRA